MQKSQGQLKLNAWFKTLGWKLLPFQQDTMSAVLAGKSGLLNAPTGSGKTYALWLPILVRASDALAKQKGLKVLWITPLKALAKDLQRNLQDACDGIEIPWLVAIRSGDTPLPERTRQKKQIPDALITTPESLHLLFSSADTASMFERLQIIVVDEWHELLGSKRGVQTELALARLRAMNPQLQTWAISATIGNLNEAYDVVMGHITTSRRLIIQAKNPKKILVKTLMPAKVQSLPWAGYLGIRMLDEVAAIIAKSRSTLIFTNTRSQTEIWYQALIEKYPEYAGASALHHGSLDKELRKWVEEALHLDKLRFVVCTSSLDLGVDFEPVETVIQVGSPKSIARFIQRAGRSGHQPSKQSSIYFVPTHALELIEAVSLRQGVKTNVVEQRTPRILSYDVLAQWMVTRAAGGGFEERDLFDEVRNTICFNSLQREEWQWLLGYITTGTPSLEVYDEFRKVQREGSYFVIKNKSIAQRHRLSIGTIVSDASLRVRFQQGKYLGNIEENFIARMRRGDVFWFAGRNLEFLRVREMTVTVKLSDAKKGVVPQWMGGRMSLSSQLSQFIRERLDNALENPFREIELTKLKPLLELQQKRSMIPSKHELLIEQFSAKDGHHIFFYPFEGRQIHEGLAALVAYRIGKHMPVSFSIAMNDYGFELVSDQYIDMALLLKAHPLLSTEHLLDDIQLSMQATEMAKRKFREIGTIAGLVFQGFPGKHMKTSQLQSSTALLFEVMHTYEKENLFIRQAYREVLEDQLDEVRLRATLERISKQKKVVRTLIKPGPLAFPIMVDRLREQLSSEKLEARVQKMLKAYEDTD